MAANTPLTHVVYTNSARCRDCYRCVRVCPVKAIRVRDEQASVEPERCIACGTCIRQCPQRAKTYRDDLDKAVRLVAEPGKAACSLAPSFVAAFPPWQHHRIPSALRRLGFGYVGETAVGAQAVARATADYVARHPQNGHLCTACPAAVNYVEKYAPELFESLVPVVSPMIAHAAGIRQRFEGPVSVIFIGPCVAKKAEAERAEHRGLVDCVLTFEELVQWLDRAGVDLASCEESAFDEVATGAARLFPLEGGSLHTSGWTTGLLDRDRLAVSGFERMRESLSDFVADRSPRIIEPLFCQGGCINGPAMPAAGGRVNRRRSVLDFARNSRDREATCEAELPLSTRFQKLGRPDIEVIREEDIRAVLESTGKGNPEDQLNCGACGYDTCRDNAVAVLQGLAQPEMCMPYMRRRAEQQVDRIMETSPNGIVVLDEQLRIVSMNVAFRRFFMCTDALLDKPIGVLLDPEPFERVADGRDEMVKQTTEHSNYSLTCHEIFYRLPKEGQLVGMFVDVTESRDNRRQLDQLRAQTVLQGRELLEHQIQMAETIAASLGENAARSEALLDKLMMLARNTSENDATPTNRSAQPDAGKTVGGQRWPWSPNTSTLK